MSTTTSQSVQCTTTTDGWGMTQGDPRVVARSSDPGNWQLSNHTAPGGDKANWIFYWSGEINSPNALVLTLAKTNVVLSKLTNEVSASQLWTLEDAEVNLQFVTLLWWKRGSILMYDMSRTLLPISPCRIQNVEQPGFSLDISWLDRMHLPLDADVLAKPNNPESDTQKWTIKAVN